MRDLVLKPILSLKGMSLRIYFVFLILPTLCGLTYYNALGNEFMMDDNNFLNGQYYSTFHSFVDLFTKTQSQHYSPLYYIINIILFRLFQGNPFPFHLISLILFYLNCVLLFILLCCLIKNEKVSFLTTTLFCLHPMNTVIVNQISSNFVLLFAFFLQLSLLNYWLYLKKYHQRILFYLISVISLMISLLCFEGALLFPLYLANALYFLKKYSLKKIIKECFPFIFLCLGYSVLWLIFAGSNTKLTLKIHSLHLSLPEYIASLYCLAQWYISNLFYPISIVWIRNIQPIQNSIWLWDLLLFIVVISFTYLLKIWKKQPMNSFALMWFVIGFCLLPLATFAHAYMGLVIEPHWFFFSSLGFFLLMATLIIQLSSVINRKLWIMFLCCLGLFFFAITHDYNALGKTEKNYAEFWLRSSPNNYQALLTLGKIHAEKREYDKALSYFKQILSTNQFEPYEVYNNIGLLHMDTQNFPEARKSIQRAIALNPSYADAYNTLGMIQFKEKNYEQAEESFQKALSLNPFFTLAQLNLADLYLMTDRENQAIHLLEKAVPGTPPSVGRRLILTKLAYLYFKQNDQDQFSRIVDIIFREDRKGESLLYLACAFDSWGLRGVAIDLLKKAIKVQPKNKELYLFCGTLLGHGNRLEEAIAVWQEGLSLDRKEQSFIDYIEDAKKLIAGKKTAE